MSPASSSTAQPQGVTRAVVMRDAAHQLGPKVGAWRNRTHLFQRSGKLRPSPEGHFDLISTSSP